MCTSMGQHRAKRDESHEARGATINIQEALHGAAVGGQRVRLPEHAVSDLVGAGLLLWGVPAGAGRWGAGGAVASAPRHGA